MSGTFLNLTNKVLARLNEVQLTSSSFATARGIQVQAKNAVNEAVRYINQREFQYPFNHATKTETLVPGTVRYTIPTDAKTVDNNTMQNNHIDSPTATICLRSLQTTTIAM